ncbi:MAG: dipeptidase [Thermodesulfobacteriota bacterium]
MLNDLLILDAHEDIAFHVNHFGRDFVNPSVPCMITLPRLREGNIRLVFNTIFVHPKHKPEKTLQMALEQFDTYDMIYREHRGEVFQIKTFGDLKRAGKNGRIGFLTLMEGADPVERPDKLGEFYERGVRIIGLTWNDKNRYASGNETEEGLSSEGRELIWRMNEFRITLDLSHINERGFWEAIGLTTLIPIASHSNARSLTNHPRNLKDDQLLAISERGGVIGIVLYNQFLRTSDKTPSIEDVFAHTDYITRVCGEDHVGIGSDMDGARIEDFPEDLRKISDLPKIAEFFLEKGYSEIRVRKIMGGNFLRVMEKNLEPTG